MSQRPLRVAVIGFGYWGPSLARNFIACPDTEIVAIADRELARRNAARALCPWAEVVAQPEDVLGNASVEAVALATPLLTHYPLAKAALEAGKHVLVELPLASSASECQRLEELAAERGRTLMVDHTYVSTSAVRKARELVQAGHLGEVLSLDAVHIELGLRALDFNVLWSLAPHELAMLDFVIGREARWVSATGARHHGPSVSLAHITIGFDGELLAHVHCQWGAPVRSRRFVITGTHGMLVHDDSLPAEPIKVYQGGGSAELGIDTALRWSALHRTGDIHVPRLEPTEAMSEVIDAFAAACLSGTAPPADVQAGLRMVRVLAAAQASMNKQGERVLL